MINWKLNKKIFIAIFTVYSAFSQAYVIRNMHTSSLICTQIEKPHTQFTIASKATSPEFEMEGKFACKTVDNTFSSTCAVSEFQPIATFSTEDGSAGCSTPEKI